MKRVAPAATAAFLLSLPQIAPGCGPKGDGVVDGDVTVHASERGRFVFYDLDSDSLVTESGGEVLYSADPGSVSGWDLAFSRWVVATNAGSSQSGDSQSRGGLLAVEGDVDAWADFAAFDARCSDFVAADATENVGALGCRGTPTVDVGYVADKLDDPDGMGPIGELSHNSSVSFWFEYDFDSHEVNPFGHVYVVETRDGRCVKLQLTDYYDAGGEGGYVSFQWAWLPE